MHKHMSLGSAQTVKLGCCGYQSLSSLADHEQLEVLQRW